MSNKVGWKEIVDRWESNEIQYRLNWCIDCVRAKGYQFKPYVGQFASLIFAFGSTVYIRAYSYDNLTCVCYSSFLKTLPSVEADSLSNELEEQRKKLKNILEKMPKGFSNYSITNEHFLSVPDFTPLSIKKATQFLDFLKSDEYEKIMLDIVHDEL